MRKLDDPPTVEQFEASEHYATALINWAAEDFDVQVRFSATDAYRRAFDSWERTL